MNATEVILKFLTVALQSIERLEEATSLHASVDRSFHTWLSFWPDHRDVVNTTRIRFDTEVLIAKSIDSQGVIHVKTIYDVNGVQFAFHWGDWSLEKGLEVSFDNSQRLLSGVRVSRLFIDPKVGFYRCRSLVQSFIAYIQPFFLSGL